MRWRLAALAILIPLVVLVGEAVGAVMGGYPVRTVPYKTLVQFKNFPVSCGYGPDVTKGPNGPPIVYCTYPSGGTQFVSFDKHGLLTVFGPHGHPFYQRGQASTGVGGTSRVPTACVTAIADARAGFANAGQAFAILAKFPPLVYKAAVAGSKHDAAALDAITTTAKRYTARLNTLLNKFVPVGDDFKAKAAACR